LILQMQEQESKNSFIIIKLGAKQEKQMKKKMEEERDEERVHRQLKELQEDFIRENNP